MKIVLKLALLLITVSAMATPEPVLNEKITKSFKETFMQAEQVNWMACAGECYQADFLLNTVRVKALYSEEGVLLKTTRVYNGDQLPPLILAKLKRKFPEREITGVTEISNEFEIAYHIVMRDQKHWYWFKSNPYGHLELTQRLTRGDIRK